MTKEELMEINEQLTARVSELEKALSGFIGPAYKSYLELARRMGKKDTEFIDISMQVGDLKRVCGFATLGGPTMQKGGIG